LRSRKIFLFFANVAGTGLSCLAKLDMRFWQIWVNGV